MKLDQFGYYILKHGRVMKAPEGFNITSWRNSHPDWLVGQSRPRGADTEPYISTVFLFSPHYGPSGKPDALWETMIFWDAHPGLNGYMWRYTSEEDARAGHAKALQFVEAAMEPYEV